MSVRKITQGQDAAVAITLPPLHPTRGIYLLFKDAEGGKTGAEFFQGPRHKMPAYAVVCGSRDC